MNAIKNTGFLNLFAGVSFAGFTPSVAYTYDATAHTMRIQDNTTYPATDSIKILHVYVTDAEGASLYGKVVAAGSGGALTLDISTLSAIEGFNVNVTVVSTNGLLADLGVYRVAATSPITGSLSYVNKQQG